MTAVTRKPFEMTLRQDVKPKPNKHKPTKPKNRFDWLRLT
jgi:hypothetical protein